MLEDVKLIMFHEIFFLKKIFLPMLNANVFFLHVLFVKLTNFHCISLNYSIKKGTITYISMNYQK